MFDEQVSLSRVRVLSNPSDLDERRQQVRSTANLKTKFKDLWGYGLGVEYQLDSLWLSGASHTIRTPSFLSQQRTCA